MAAIKARIQSRKCWCENFYMHVATGTGYTINAECIIAPNRFIKYNFIPRTTE